MSDSVKLVLNSPSDGWLLIQAGFKIRAKNWNELHSARRFIIYVYDVLPIAKDELPEATRNGLDPEDSVWEDRETGNVLVVRSKESNKLPIFQVLPK
jgi:hypothetical protein